MKVLFFNCSLKNCQSDDLKPAFLSDSFFNLVSAWIFNFTYRNPHSMLEQTEKQKPTLNEQIPDGPSHPHSAFFSLTSTFSLRSGICSLKKQNTAACEFKTSQFLGNFVISSFQINDIFNCDGRKVCQVCKEVGLPMVLAGREIRKPLLQSLLGKQTPGQGWVSKGGEGMPMSAPNLGWQTVWRVSSDGFGFLYLVPSSTTGCIQIACFGGEFYL